MIRFALQPLNTFSPKTGENMSDGHDGQRIGSAKEGYARALLYYKYA